MNLLNRVADFYHESFLTNPTPQEYLTSLGITKPEIFKAFKIGYSDGKLLNTLPNTDDLTDELKKLGILNREGKEHFLGRVTFPLYDTSVNVVGIYGRKKGNFGKGKHQYLPGKRGVFNPQAAASSSEIILTSSITDALVLYQNGCPNAIPLIDNELNQDHLDLFNAYRPKKVYLCMNNNELDSVTDKLKEIGLKVAVIQLPDNQNLFNFLRSNHDFKEVLARADENEGQSSGFLVTEIETGILIICQDREYRLKSISSQNSDRLKVNIRASLGGKYHIDTLDLYQSRARRYLSSQLAKLFDLKPEEMDSDLLYIINETEKYLAKQAEKKDEPQVYQLTKEEEGQAISFLKSSDLLNKIRLDMETLGHVGEETNKLLTYLISISHKLPRPLSGIIISGSGAGKSGLVEIVQELTPPEDVVFYSRITPQALYYMERDALKRKLLIIEERTGGEGADYSIRVLQSRQKISQAVPIRDPNSGKIKTMTFEAEGPIAFLETTTNAEMNHENATRCFEIYLDESIEQTKRIHHMQRENKTESGLAKKAEIETIKTRHHNLQRVLKPVFIEIPYAPLLDFPADSLRTRRDHERFLSLIEVITFLFQYQRKQRELTTPGGEKVTVVISTIEDYANAYELAQGVLGLTLDDLKKHARDLLELIKQLVDQKLQETGEITFTRREIREFTGWQDHQIKAHIKYLEEMEYLIIRKVKERGQFEYHLNNPEERRPLKGLLTAAELKKLLSLQKTN